MFKKISFGVLVLLVILSVWAVVNNVDLKTEPTEQDSITVSDSATEITLKETAEKEFSPEVAKIIVGVETMGESVSAAFTENNKKMNQVTEQLKQLESLSLKTLNFNVSNRTRMKNGKEKISYRVLNQIELTTSNLNQLGQIIQKAVTAGANQILSIQYELKDKKKARRKVTEIAINKLEKKITHISQKINKDQVGLNSMQINDNYIGVRDNVRFQAQGLKSAETAIPPISPQNITIKVSINATYAAY